MSEVLVIDRDRPDDLSLARAAEVVRSGGLIVYPTETLYGIGADATNPRAVRKVFASKGRSEGKPIPVLVDSERMLLDYVREVPPAASLLIRSFWPGPLTIIFHAGDRVPDGLSPGSRTIGVRIPSSPLCVRLVGLVGTPLTSTSANPSGADPSRTIAGMQSGLRGIDVFLDGGELPESLPSTIVDVTRSRPRIIRAGATPVGRVRALIPEIDG